MPIPPSLVATASAGIPTVIAFDQGEERRRHVGVANIEVLQSLTGVAA